MVTQGAHTHAARTAHIACPPSPLARSQMMNAISQLGPEIAMGRDENLHTSGHAYKCVQ